MNAGWHRAKARLGASGATCKWFWEACASWRKAGVEWAEHIYLPTSEVGCFFADALTKAQGRGAFDALQREARRSSMTHITNWVDEALTLGTWRLSQGIYRFDPTLYDALVHTPLNGDIPSQLLLRLPEWCVYVETPGADVPSSAGDVVPLHGFWARNDLLDCGSPSLAIGLDTDSDALVHYHVAIDGSVETAVRRAFEGGRMGQEHVMRRVREVCGVAINLLLYLCAEAPDVMRGGIPSTPARPVAARTKQGLRHFPAERIVQWDVGVRLGAAIRRAGQAEGTREDQALRRSGPRAATRPHIRRGHWHAYLRGSRKRSDGAAVPANERHRELRWMPPLPIGVWDLDALPASVRQVL